MGKIDRIVRVGFAIVVAGLYLTDQINGTAAIVLGIFAGIFVVTSLVGSCPLYSVFGLSTKKAN